MMKKVFKMTRMVLVILCLAMVAYAGAKRRRDRLIPTPWPENSDTLTGAVRQFVLF